MTRIRAETVPEQPKELNQSEPTTPVSAEKSGLAGTLRRHALLTMTVMILAAAAIAGGVVWWREARQYVSTDDAFIDARSVSVSSQVSGAIVDLPVTDNQSVQPGEVLARIDDRDYRTAVDQAKAQVNQAQASIANLNAQIEAQRARIDQAQKQAAQAQAALTFAREQNTRAQDLFEKGAGSQQTAQQAASDLRQNQATSDAQQANLLVAQKQVAVLQTQRDVAAGQLDQARAAVERAQADLARTDIKAPTTGSIANLTAAKGDFAQVGEALMTLVPRDVWVTANFKETQLANVRPGQPVDVYVDAHPGVVLHGHVDSIQAGSGSAFALLPPENATGNYVKVVQRVPVKIDFDQRPDLRLGPGMSVEPYVKVQ